MKRVLGSLTLPHLCIAAVCGLILLASVPAHADGIPAFGFTTSDFRTDDMDTAELGYTFTIGIVQEALTYVVMRYFVWPDEFRTNLDGVAYCIAAAVAYATVVNLSTVLSTPGITPDVTALRVFDTIAIQYATSAVLGYGLAQVTYSRPTPLLLTLTLALRPSSLT